MESINKLIKNYNIADRSLPIREKSKRTRYFIDNEYFGCGYGAYFSKNTTVIYNVLAKYANYETQMCFPSLEKIIEETGIKNRNTVIDSINELCEYNIIIKFKSDKRDSNRYVLIRPEAWKLLAVSNSNAIEYQKQANNSINVNTGIHINNYNKEISSNISQNIPQTNAENHPSIRFSAFAPKFLSSYFSKTDIDNAVNKIRSENNIEAEKITTKELLDALKNINAIPIKAMPIWLKY